MKNDQFIDVLVCPEGVVDLDGQTFTPECLKNAAEQAERELGKLLVSNNFSKDPPIGTAVMRYEEGVGLIADIELFKCDPPVSFIMHHAALEGRCVRRVGNVIEATQLRGIGLTLNPTVPGTSKLKNCRAPKKPNLWNRYIEGLDD